MSIPRFDEASFRLYSGQGRRAKIEGLTEVIRFLRKYQPEVLKELKKDIGSEIKPLVSEIVSEINSEVTSQLLANNMQMFHNGKTAWNGVRYTPRVTSNRAGLIKLTFTGRGGKLGFDYAELAGIERRPPRLRSKSWPARPRGYSLTGQGTAFNTKLKRDFGKPGRFAWIRVIKKRTQINRQINQILDRYNIKVNGRLKGGIGKPGGLI